MKIQLLAMAIIALVFASCNNTQPTDKGTSATDPSMSKAPDTTLELRSDSPTVDSLADSTKNNKNF